MFVNGRWLNLDVAGLAIKRHQFQRDGTLSPFLREDGTQSGWSGGERVVASNLKNDRVVMRLSHVSVVPGPWRRDAMGGTCEGGSVRLNKRNIYRMFWWYLLSTRFQYNERPQLSMHYRVPESHVSRIPSSTSALQQALSQAASSLNIT